MKERRDPFEMLRRWLIVASVITLTMRFLPLPQSSDGFEPFHESRMRSTLDGLTLCFVSIGNLVIGGILLWKVRREADAFILMRRIRQRLSLFAVVSGILLTSRPILACIGNFTILESGIFGVIAGVLTFVVLLLAGKFMFSSESSEDSPANP